jgi:hypothetical protein
MAGLEMNASLLLNGIGLLITVFLTWFAVQVATMMKGGQFERVWKLIAYGITCLTFFKIVDWLEYLDVIKVIILGDLFELVMILFFFAGFWMAYRSLLFMIRGPKIETPSISLPEGKQGEGAVKQEETGSVTQGTAAVDPV